MVSAERLKYKCKRDRARRKPQDYCSIIVDGAYQSALRLPHFTTTNGTRGQAMKVKLVGVLEQKVENCLRFYTITEENKKGANHIVECIRRFLFEKHTKSPVPPPFFIQLDNCTPENENRYLMVYFACSVTWGVFQEVITAFLLVGHTQENIDQAFSRTSHQLETQDARTLSNLHEQLRAVF